MYFALVFHMGDSLVHGLSDSTILPIAPRFLLFFKVGPELTAYGPSSDNLRLRFDLLRDQQQHPGISKDSILPGYRPDLGIAEEPQQRNVRKRFREQTAVDPALLV